MTAMQGSIGEVPCRDKEDARTRVYDARQGSLIESLPGVHAGATTTATPVDAGS